MLKYANNITKRKHGTTRCHGCIKQRKVKELSKPFTRSYAKKRSRPKPK